MAVNSYAFGLFSLILTLELLISIGNTYHWYSPKREVKAVRSFASSVIILCRNTLLILLQNRRCFNHNYHLIFKLEHCSCIVKSFFTQHKDNCKT